MHLKINFNLLFQTICLLHKASSLKHDASLFIRAVLKKRLLRNARPAMENRAFKTERATVSARQLVLCKIEIRLQITLKYLK